MTIVQGLTDTIQGYVAHTSGKITLDHLIVNSKREMDCVVAKGYIFNKTLVNIMMTVWPLKIRLNIILSSVILT